MDDRLKTTATTKATNRFKDGYLADERHIQGVHDKNKEVQVSEELHIRYAAARSKWEKKARECERFRVGYQWTQAEVKELERKRKAPIVVNLINPAVEQFKAMLTSREPRYNALPREGSDRKTATAISSLMEHIWQFNQGNVVLKETLDDYSVKGLGWIGAWWDPNADMGKGEVINDVLDPYDIFVDPQARKRDFSDARHILVVKYWSQEDIMNRFPSISEKFFEDAERKQPESYTDSGGDPDQVDIEGTYDGETDYYEVIDRYSQRHVTMVHYRHEGYEFTIEKKDRKEFTSRNAYIMSTINLMDGTTQLSYILEDDEIRSLMKMMKQLGTVWHTKVEVDNQGQMQQIPVPGPANSEMAISQTMIKQTTIAKLIESEVIEETEYPGDHIYRVMSIGGKLYYKGYTGTSIYPLVPFPNRHKRNPYPLSDVHATIQLQRELNVTRQHIMTHTANVASIRVAMPRGSGKVDDIEEKFNKAGVVVVEYSPEDGGAPHFIYPPQMPSQLYESEQRFSSTIYEQFGIYPFMGNSGAGGGHSTSSGILIMDELAQRRIASKRSDIEYSLNRLGKVNVELIQRHYTKHKVIRLIQPSGRFHEIEINSPLYESYDDKFLERINDVTIGKYDLIMESGSTLPSNRMIRMEYFFKLYSQGLIDQYETLKNMDEVDVEGVMERMGILQQLQGQVEAMSEEIKKLEGDLQTADREAVGARKRVEVEKFKAQLAQMKASIDVQINRAKDKAVESAQQQADSTGLARPAVDTSLYEQVNQL